MADYQTIQQEWASGRSVRICRSQPADDEADSPVTVTLRLDGVPYELTAESWLELRMAVDEALEALGTMS